MQSAGIYRSSKLVDLLNRYGVPLLVIYMVSMVVYPWFDGPKPWFDLTKSWTHVQIVWDRWQTLNAAALAVVASVIALNITRFNENVQRERDFEASKAFLPSTLSGLMDYSEKSALVYRALWQTDGKISAPLEHPQLPTDYREVFSNCIRHSEPTIGTYLAKILVKLQVHNSRLREVVDKSGRGYDKVINRHALISYLYSLGELYVLMANLFDFARGEAHFSTENPSWDNYKNAYGVLKLPLELFNLGDQMGLEAFTKRALSRAENEQADA